MQLGFGLSQINSYSIAALLCDRETNQAAVGSRLTLTTLFFSA
jgi:hypothetical protein